MTKNRNEFKANYDGREIRPDEVMVAFPCDELEAENCVNRECIDTVTQAGRRFRVIYKAVPAQWEKQAASALTLVENEELGHYFKKDSVSMDAVRDGYELELGVTQSTEDEVLERLELDETVQTFVDLVSGLIERCPKLGYAVLLLNTDIRGEEFYSRMLLTRDPANRIRKQAENILNDGLANFDINTINCYKSKNDAIYRRRAYQLLEEIVKEIR